MPDTSSTRESRSPTFAGAVASRSGEEDEGRLLAFDWEARLAENLGSSFALLPAESPLSLTELPPAPPHAQDAF